MGEEVGKNWEHLLTKAQSREQLQVFYSQSPSPNGVLPQARPQLLTPPKLHHQQRTEFICQIYLKGAGFLIRKTTFSLFLFPKVHLAILSNNLHHIRGLLIALM